MSQVTHDAGVEPSRKVMVVSADAHVGPPIGEYLQYCPSKYREEFEAFRAAVETPADVEETFQALKLADAEGYTEALNAILDQTLVHYDPHAALTEMDADGVAAQVVFHGAQNRNPIPFVMGTFGGSQPWTGGHSGTDLAIAGLRMYNRWLADYCAAAPERFVGLAQVPMWDIDAAVTELEFARQLGLRGVNFPAPRPSIPDYNDLQWEPFWSAAEAHDMSLNTHGASSPIVHDLAKYNGVDAVYSMILDLVTFSWRGLQFMLLGGVFERHPALKLVMTEQPPEWVPSTLRDVDALWRYSRWESNLPKPPSEYFHSNCYIGASFMSKGEVRSAIENELTYNVLWGSDFPHIEGTWPYTRLSLRSSMEGVPPDVVERLVGENAARVFSLDRAALQSTVDRIGPTSLELSTPVTDGDIPDAAKWTKGFRQDGGYFS